MAQNKQEVKLEQDLAAVQKEITKAERDLSKLYAKRERLINKALASPFSWSQRKVAKILGVTRSAIYKFARKRREK